jgi:hypothetical protein
MNDHHMAPERRVRFERRLRDWTTYDVADRMVRLATYLAQPDPEITAEMVTGWEDGEKISPARLVLLSVVLDLPVELLMPMLDPSWLAPWVVLDRTAGTMSDEVLRREFLTLVAGLASTAVVDPERVGAAFGPRTRVDRELVGQLQRVVRLCAGQYDRMPSGLLRQRAHCILDAVKAMLAAPLPPGMRPDVLALGAEVAVLAGWSSRSVGHLDEASGYDR